MSKKPIKQKYKYYMSCGDHKHIMMGHDYFSVCSFFIKMVLGMNRKPKIGQFIYISEGGFKSDIEKYCGPLTRPPIFKLRTEHVLREIKQIDLADRMLLYFEKEQTDDFTV